MLDGVISFGFERPISIWALLNSQFVTALIVLVAGQRIKVVLQQEREQELERQEAETQRVAAEGEKMKIVDELRQGGIPAAKPRPSTPRARYGDQSDEDNIPTVGSGVSAGGDNFNKAARIILGLKKDVDDLVASLDGRTQRKYARWGRRDYSLNVVGLYDDGAISDALKVDFVDAFETWRPYSTNRASVPDEVVTKIRGLAERIKVELAGR